MHLSVILTPACVNMLMDAEKICCCSSLGHKYHRKWGITIDSGSAALMQTMRRLQDDPHSIASSGQDNVVKVTIRCLCKPYTQALTNMLQYVWHHCCILRVHKLGLLCAGHIVKGRCSCAGALFC